MSFALILTITRLGYALPSTGEHEYVDVESKHNFRSFSTVVKQEGDYGICVEDEVGASRLWNPVSDKISSTGANCIVPSRAIVVIPLVSTPKLNGIASEGFNASFARAQSIYRDSVGISKNCGPNFANYFTLNLGSAGKKSFYIISKLQKPRTVTVQPECSGSTEAATYKQDYDSVGMLESLDLGDDNSLLLSINDSNHPIIIKLSGIPKRSIAFPRAKVYLILKEDMDRSFEATGNSEAERNKAVNLLIDQLQK